MKYSTSPLSYLTAVPALTDVCAMARGCSHPSRASEMASSKDGFGHSPHLQFLLSRPAYKDWDKIFHAGLNCLWKVSGKKRFQTCQKNEV